MALQEQTSLRYRPWLHAFAMLVVISVFMLIALGGTVTSRAAGMTVPDWPNTFGHNMFAVPWELWVDFDEPLTSQRGEFWEHSHRLKGSWVGILAIIMAVWLPMTQHRRKWFQVLGPVLLGMVIIQGLMGGFRVTENSLFLAFVHGVFGQIIFGITVLIAAATSKIWLRFANEGPRPVDARLFARLRAFSLVMIGLIVMQLVLGAWVRHAGAGLAIPTFPDNFGSVTVPITETALDEARNNLQDPVARARVYTVEQVFIHFTHRIGAVIVTVTAFVFVGLVMLRMSRFPEAVIPSLTFIGLIVLQVMLGISVVLTGRNPEVATSHQSVGAAALGVAVWLAARIYLVSYFQNPYRQRDIDDAAETATSASPSPAPSDTGDKLNQPASLASPQTSGGVG